jgi:hypothetical protein
MSGTTITLSKIYADIFLPLVKRVQATTNAELSRNAADWYKPLSIVTLVGGRPQSEHGLVLIPTWQAWPYAPVSLPASVAQVLLSVLP